MATSSFDKTFVIAGAEAQNRLLRIMAEEDKNTYINEGGYVYDACERERSEGVLDRFLSRSAY